MDLILTVQLVCLCPQNLKADTVKYPVIPVAEIYLEKLIQARSLLSHALQAVEENALIQAVEFSESFGYDTEEVRQARVLRDNVMQINAEAAQAVVYLEEEPMKSVVQRADAVRLTTPEIEQLRTLLFNTPEEKFVQLQLKATVALKDPARGIRVTIRLKDLFFKKAVSRECARGLFQSECVEVQRSSTMFLASFFSSGSDVRVRQLR